MGAAVGRLVEHVAAAEQALRAGRVQDDAAVDLEATAKAIAAGKLALIRPVTTSTDGRWVARTRWMPVARASWARRVMGRSVSSRRIIRSASSSMMITR